jgi:hypothetical protein
MDITELILFQHHEQRRMFALLDDIDPADSAALGAVWHRLAVLLEVHAEAEEKFFYPRLLEIGTGQAGESDSDAETKDAIKDHNEIRDAVRKAADAEPGSDDWWKAVTDARIANGDHMAEEEREDLPDFRRNASLQLRHDIAVEFCTFEARHAGGVESQDKDPQAYVDRNS